MIRKQKHGETGDSEDLQALFDEIATGEPVIDSRPAPVEPKPVSADGDNDDLQALFDSVAESSEATLVAEAPASDAVEDPASEDERVFKRVGVMTRQVHDALRTLLGEASLKDAVEAIPDARQRLNYIALMTEQAASRVLNATDIAQPLQTQLESGAERLHGQWEKVFANKVSVDEFKSLAQETHRFLGQTRENSHATGEQLLEIMMAQDFQDLTGQVIKRVVDLAQTLESELLTLLIEITPPDKMPARPEGLMNGPVIDSRGREDVVTSQEQVDDLLDSLGF